VAETDKALSRLQGRNDVAEFTAALHDGRAKLVAMTEWINAESQKDANLRGAVANEYLRAFTLVAYAWMWTLMAEQAFAKKDAGDPFYDTKLTVGRYFVSRVMPQLASLDGIVRSGSASMMALAEAAF